MIERARCAYSGGRPSRRGNGMLAASAWRAGSGSPARSGVSKRPGAIVTTRIPSEARSRAIGSVMADHGALRRRVRDLADLSVVGGDRRGVHDDAALAVGVGRVLAHPVRLEADRVERADHVHLEDLLERLERVRAFLGDGALRPADAGAVDRHPDRAELGDRAVDRGLRPRRPWSRRRGRRWRRRPSSFANASPFERGRSRIATRAPAAASSRAVAPPRPDAPPVTTAPAPWISTASSPAPGRCSR